MNKGLLRADGSPFIFIFRIGVLACAVFACTLLLSFFFNPVIAQADGSTISLNITASGDVPAVSVSCVAGHNYTLALVHEDLGTVISSFGVVQRIYCAT